jgi:hypothetical protein
MVDAYTFLEVQSQYHFPAMPFIQVMAGYGAAGILSRIRYPGFLSTQRRATGGIIMSRYFYPVLVAAVIMVFGIVFYSYLPRK